MSFALLALLAVQVAALRAHRLAGDGCAASALVAFGLPGRAVRAASRAADPLGLRRPGHTGTLVVNESAVRDVVVVFRRLYRARFPVRRMRPIDVYGGDDERSLAADNTAGSTAATPSAPALVAGRRTRTAWRSTSTRSRTPTSRAAECIRAPAGPTWTGRTFRPGHGRARQGARPRVRRGRLAVGRPLGAARPTTSTSRRPAASCA